MVNGVVHFGAAVVPSDSVSVRVTWLEAAGQVNVVLAEPGAVNVPAVAVHAKVTVSEASESEPMALTAI